MSQSRRWAASPTSSGGDPHPPHDRTPTPIPASVTARRTRRRSSRIRTRARANRPPCQVCPLRAARSPVRRHAKPLSVVEPQFPHPVATVRFDMRIGRGTLYVHVHWCVEEAAVAYLPHHRTHGGLSAARVIRDRRTSPRRHLGERQRSGSRSCSPRRKSARRSMSKCRSVEALTAPHRATSERSVRLPWPGATLFFRQAPHRRVSATLGRSVSRGVQGIPQA